MWSLNNHNYWQQNEIHDLLTSEQCGVQFKVIVKKLQSIIKLIDVGSEVILRNFWHFTPKKLFLCEKIESLMEIVVNYPERKERQKSFWIMLLCIMAIYVNVNYRYAIIFLKVFLMNFCLINLQIHIYKNKNMNCIISNNLRILTIISNCVYIS